MVSPRLTPYDSRHHTPTPMFGLQDSHLGLPELAYLIISLWVAPFLKPLALPSPAPITLFPFTFVHTRFTVQHNFCVSLYKDKIHTGKPGFLQLMFILCGRGFFTLSNDTSVGDQLPPLLYKLFHLHLTM